MAARGALAFFLRLAGHGAAHAIELVFGLALVHEGRVHGKAHEPGAQQVGHGMGHVERHGVVEVPAPVSARRDGKLVALAVAQTPALAAPFAARATPIALSCRREKAVPGHHQLLAAGHDQPERQRAFVGDELHLVDGQLGRQPHETRSERRPRLHRMQIRRVELRSYGAPRLEFLQLAGYVGVGEINARGEGGLLAHVHDAREVERGCRRAAPAGIPGGQLAFLVGCQRAVAQLVQGRKPDARTFGQLHVPTVRRIAGGAQAPHMGDDILARDGLRTRGLDRITCRAPFDTIRIAHTYLQRSANLHLHREVQRHVPAVRRPASARLAQSRRAHPKDAVARADRPFHPQFHAPRLHDVAVGGARLVHDAPVLGPYLEQVASQNRLRGLYPHAPAREAGHAPDGHPAVVGALAAHQLGSAHAGEVSTRETAGERLGHLRALVVCRGKALGRLAGPVERGAVGSRHAGDVLGRFHTSLDFERRNTCRHEAGQHVERVQVLGREQKLAVCGDGAPVCVHERIRQAARLGAHAAIRAAPAHHRAEQALARLAYAQGAVREHLQLHALAS